MLYFEKIIHYYCLPKYLKLNKISLTIFTFWKYIVDFFEPSYLLSFKIELNSQGNILDWINFWSTFVVILALAEFEILTEVVGALAGRVSQSCLTD